MVTEAEPTDLILRNLRGEIDTIYRFVRLGDDGQPMYLAVSSAIKDGAFANRDILSQLESLGYTLEEAPRIFGISIVDIVDRIEKATAQTLSGEQLGDMAIRWQSFSSVPDISRFVRNVLNDLGRLFKTRSVYDRMGRELVQLMESKKGADPDVVASAFRDLYLADKPAKLDLSQTDAMSRLMEISNEWLDANSPYPRGDIKRQTDSLTIELTGLINAWSKGLPIDQYRQNTKLNEFIAGMEPIIIPGTFTDVGAETAAAIADVGLAAALNNYRQYIFGLQALYGVQRGQELAMKYLRDYQKEFNPSKFKVPKEVPPEMADLVFPELMTGELPDLTDPNEYNRFITWAGEREDERIKSLSIDQQIAIKTSNIRVLMDEYAKALPGFGLKLFEQVMAEQERAGLDLTLPSSRFAFPEPEDALAAFVPPDVEQMATQAGLDVKEMELFADVDFSDIDKVQASVRRQVISRAMPMLQQGTLNPDVQEGLRSLINEMTLKLPPPEGGRKFFLMQPEAQEEFRTWLAKNMQPGRERNVAFEFFPQLWQRFTEEQSRTEPTGKEPFRQFVSGLGSTFFSRLSPKRERVSQPKAARVPGGGRIPLQ